jgi:hypothetical protein
MRVLSLVMFLGFGCRDKEVTTVEEDIRSDLDGDGFTDDVDCDDLDLQVYPEAMEICDGIDNNCDGNIDEDVQQEFYADSDGDGFGNAEITVEACEAPSGFVDTGSDCNDSSATSYPAAEELCDGLDNDCDEEIDEDLDLDFYMDSDGDGFGNEDEVVSGCAPELDLSTIGGDCDDNDPAISPVANELCNEIDDNCNGETDEGVQVVFYNDQDQDGFGDAATTAEACTTPEGYVDNADDCNDIDSQVQPNADEICDAQDNDCDGDIDEEGAIGGLIWYQDADLDGYGNPDSTAIFCEQPSGYVENADDCDDSNSIFSPAAPEICNGYDDNCDGMVDEDGAVDAITWFLDGDGDGFGNASDTLDSCSQPSGYLADDTDCDDDDNDINPDATEVCNGEDDNCDGSIDGTDASDIQMWYADADEDGYGDATVSELSCTMPTGYVENADDCDDDNINLSPETTWYADADEDGYGTVLYSTESCAQPSGYVTDSSDCDDTESTAYPTATEVCDGRDNDCDGDIDTGASDQLTWYFDGDEDGYGGNTITEEACDAPSGYVAAGNDCDDTEAAAYPTATEICDEIDNDCDGVVDTGAVDESTSYSDVDEDGFGDAATMLVSCDIPVGNVTDDTDCDDTQPTAYPTATEVCDGIDNDCDGVVDTGAVDESMWYIDVDEDGYGDSATSQTACDAPTGYVANAEDCDDTDGFTHPGAADTESGTIYTITGDDSITCSSLGYRQLTSSECEAYALSVGKSFEEYNGVSADESGCMEWGSNSGIVEHMINTEEETCKTGSDCYCYDENTECMTDADEDGYGDANPTNSNVTSGSDCDDGDSGIMPDATEVCDGLDNNCDGDIDEGAVLGSEALCAAESCDAILTEDPTAEDGVYYIESDTGSSLEAYCEMDFDDGGWLAVFNYVHGSGSSASDFHNRIIQNDDMTSAVQPDDNSSSIMTSNIDLSQYSEIVYGWAPSANDDVNRYGRHSDPSGLVGKCYVDGYCGANVSIGNVEIQPTGNTREIYTGNSPSYPHVGLGFSGQIIVWGYDLNGSTYSSWANWYDGNPCCNAGNTSDIASNSAWRYTVYIR